MSLFLVGGLAAAAAALGVGYRFYVYWIRGRGPVNVDSSSTDPAFSSAPVGQQRQDLGDEDIQEQRRINAKLEQEKPGGEDSVVSGTSKQEKSGAENRDSKLQVTGGRESEDVRISDTAEIKEHQSKHKTAPAQILVASETPKDDVAADKLSAQHEPVESELQNENQEVVCIAETQAVPTKSPPPQVAPKPAPQSQSRPPSKPSSVSPASPVPAKPVVHARKQVFSPNAVPVLPVAFLKESPQLRRTAEVRNNSEDNDSRVNGQRQQLGSLLRGMNGNVMAAVRSEGESETPISFDEVGTYMESLYA